VRKVTLRMSHITATLHAFDCMDQVHATLTLKDHDQHEDSEPYPTLYAVTFPGSGESDHREWVRDLLVAMLEAI
jgi:hypothetical protein